MGLIPNKFWNILKGRAKTSGNIGGIVSVATKQGVISNVRCGTKITQGDQVSLFRTDGRIWYAISLSPQTQRIRKETHFLGKVQSKRMVLDDNFASYPFKIIAIQSDGVTFHGGNVDIQLLDELSINLSGIDIEDEQVFVSLINYHFLDQYNKEYKYKATVTGLKVNGSTEDNLILFLNSTSKENYIASILPVKKYKEITKPAFQIPSFEELRVMEYKEGTKIVFNGKEFVLTEYTLIEPIPRYSGVLEGGKIDNWPPDNEDNNTYVELNESPNIVTCGMYAQPFPYNLRQTFEVGLEFSFIASGYYTFFDSFTGVPIGDTVVVDPAPVKAERIIKFSLGGTEIYNPTGISTFDNDIIWGGATRYTDMVRIRYSEPQNLINNFSSAANGGINLLWKGYGYGSYQEGIRKEIISFSNSQYGENFNTISNLAYMEMCLLNSEDILYNVQRTVKTIDGSNVISDETTEIRDTGEGILPICHLLNYLGVSGGHFFLELDVNFSLYKNQQIPGYGSNTYFKNYKGFEYWSLCGSNYGIEKSMTHAMVTDSRYEIFTWLPIYNSLERTMESVHPELFSAFPPYDLDLRTQVKGEPQTPNLLQEVVKSVNSDDIIFLDETITYNTDILYKTTIADAPIPSLVITTVTTVSYSFTGMSKYTLNGIELPLADSLYSKVSIETGTLPDEPNQNATVVFKLEDDNIRRGFSTSGYYSLNLEIEETFEASFWSEQLCPTDLSPSPGGTENISYPTSFNLLDKEVIYSTKTKSYRGVITDIQLKKKQVSVHVGDKPVVRDKGLPTERYAYVVTPRRYTFPDDVDYGIDRITVVFFEILNNPCANNGYLFTPDNCNTIACFDPDYFRNRLASDGMNLYRQGTGTNSVLVFSQSRPVKEENGFLFKQDQDWFVDIFFFNETNNKFVYSQTSIYPITHSLPIDGTLFLADISFYPAKSSSS